MGVVRRSWVSALVCCLAATGLAACSGESSEPAGMVVDADGSSFDLGDVVVTVPAGSVPAGTAVAAQTVAPDQAPTRFEGVDLTALGPGAEIAFDGGGLQPEVPLEVTIGGDDLVALDEVGTAAALVVESDDGSLDLVSATVDAARGTVRGEVPHLSRFWPVTIDVDRLLDTVQQSIGVTSDEPGCVDQPATVGALSFTVVSTAFQWMCIESSGDRLRVTATSNAGVPYVATPSRRDLVVANRSDATLTGSLAVALSSSVAVLDPTQGVLFPGGSATFTTPSAPSPFEIDFAPDGQLYILQILTEVLDVALGGIRSDTLERIGKLECASRVFPTGVSAGLDGITPGVLADVVTSFFTCVGPILGELSLPKRILLAILSAGPGLLVGGILTIVTTLTGEASTTASITTTGASTVDDADLAPYVGTWAGPIDQPGSSPYTTALLIEITDGRFRGRVNYPELGCSGYFSDARTESGALLVTENIADGSGCIPVVDITLRREGAQLTYEASDGGEVIATGTLDLTPDADLGNGTEPVEGASAWPEDRDDGPPALYAWIGAGLRDYPDWVACDQPQDWCLLGGTGEHTLVLVDGLEEMGTVLDGAADPLAALVGLGMPAGAAQELLVGS